MDKNTPITIIFTNEFVDLNEICIGETYFLTGVILKRPSLTDNFGTKPIPNKKLYNDILLQVIEIVPQPAHKINTQIDYYVVDENIHTLLFN